MWDFAEIGHKFWNTLSYKLGRMGERNPRRNAETLLTAWNGFWSAGHLAALLSEHVGEFNRIWVEEKGQPLIGLTGKLVDAGFLPTIARAMRLPLGLAETSLQEYETYLADESDHRTQFEGLGGLVAMCLGHAELRPRVLGLQQQPFPLLKRYADEERAARLIRALPETRETALKAIRDVHLPLVEGGPNARSPTRPCASSASTN